MQLIHVDRIGALDAWRDVVHSDRATVSAGQGDVIGGHIRCRYAVRIRVLNRRAGLQLVDSFADIAGVVAIHGVGRVADLAGVCVIARACTQGVGDAIALIVEVLSGLLQLAAIDRVLAVARHHAILHVVQAHGLARGVADQGDVLSGGNAVDRTGA
ncbi:hypothetical protein D3C85_1401230 [compost metagenome]